MITIFRICVIIYLCIQTKINKKFENKGLHLILRSIKKIGFFFHLLNYNFM